MYLIYSIQQQGFLDNIEWGHSPIWNVDPRCARRFETRDEALDVRYRLGMTDDDRWVVFHVESLPMSPAEQREADGAEDEILNSIGL